MFDLVDEALELGDLVLQGAVAGGSEGEPGARALALVALLDVDQSGLLQDGQVLAEVSGREAKDRAQKAELDPARLVGDGEDAEADALVDDVVPVSPSRLASSLPAARRPRPTRNHGERAPIPGRVHAAHPFSLNSSQVWAKAAATGTSETRPGRNRVVTCIDAEPVLRAAQQETQQIAQP
ncbi:hypothetical protein TNCT6_77310 [Streptomyces sp. 6-11-2]|nr:hypothetical protein TNCT6_77310 [Streptomyces sp. 6-11-2]